MSVFDPVGRELLGRATPGTWEPAESEHYGHLLWVSGVDYDPSDPTGQTAMQTQEILADHIATEADARLIAHMRTGYPAALDAIDRILALHADDGTGHCRTCLTYTSPMPQRRAWPCATVRALNGEDA